jgi:hypothetical protein
VVYLTAGVTVNNLGYIFSGDYNTIAIYRDSIQIANTESDNLLAYLTPTLVYVDKPSLGTHIYTLEYNPSSNGSGNFLKNHWLQALVIKQ